MLFFLLLKPGNHISYTPFPEMDKPTAETAYYLHPGLPLVYILKLHRWLDGNNKFLRISQSELQTKILKQLTKVFGSEFDLEWRPITPDVKAKGDCEKADKVVKTEEAVEAENQSGTETSNKSIYNLLSGRQLTENDLRNLAKAENIQYNIFLQEIHKLVQKGAGEWIPALEQRANGWQCLRCGETGVENWFSIYGEAATCLNCNALGDLSSLQAVYRDHRPLQAQSQTVLFSPHWELTPAQARASLEVLEFVQDTEESESLLWAACGAGKTEVCFPAAAWALKQQKSVLFAAPRQDVIHDVAPRIARDFPGLEYQVLSGANPLKFQTGNLVLATTHQVLRFYQAFDLVFLDEFDAFPYRGSRMLEWGLKHALKPGGKLLFLTATPSKEKLNELKHRKYIIRLPARHHRKPVPLPIWDKLGIDGVKDINDCPQFLFLKLARLAEKGTVMLFVPMISWVEALVKILRHRLPELKIEGSYSSDPLRSEKIRDLKSLKFNIFVTTSILERGVTIPNTQVIVLAADHELFDERSLVQMAGRAGRTREYPWGEVIFCSKQKTTAIKTAIQWIEEQNRLAKSLALLD